MIITRQWDRYLLNFASIGNCLLVETDVVIRLPAFKYIYVKLEMSNGFLSVYLYVQVTSFVYTNEIKDGRLKSMCKKAFSDW